MKKKIFSILGVALTLVLLVSLFGFAVPVSADPGNNAWEKQSTPSILGGRVLSNVGAALGPLAQNSDGTALYAYDSSGTPPFTLFKSTNGGRTWAATRAVPAAAIVAIACSPTEPDVVYFATATTVFKSTNGGASFIILAAAPAGGHTITALDVTKYGDFYMVGIGTAAAGNAGDFFLLDESVTFPAWANMGFNANPTIGGGNKVDIVVAVAFSPNFLADRGVMAIGADTGGNRTYISVKLAGAAWGGGTIGTATLLYDCTVGSIAFPTDFDAAFNPNFFFGIDDAAAAVGGVYVFFGIPAASVTSLLPGSSPNQIQSLAVSGPMAVATIMAGTTGGRVIRSLNGGTSWTPVFKAPSGTGAAWVVLDQADATMAYVLIGGVNGGLSRSTDSGATWNQISLVLSAIFSIDDLAFADGTIFMATTTTSFTPGVSADSFRIMATASGPSVGADTLTVTGSPTGMVICTLNVVSGSATAAITTNGSGSAVVAGNAIYLFGVGDIATITATSTNTGGTIAVTGPGAGGENVVIGVDVDGDATIVAPVANVWTFLLPDAFVAAGTNDVATFTVTAGQVTVSGVGAGTYNVGGPYTITFTAVGQTSTLTATAVNTTGVTAITGGAPWAALWDNGDGDASLAFPGAYSLPDVQVAAGARINEIWRWDGSYWDRVFTSTTYGAANMVELVPGTATTLFATLSGGTAPTTIWRSINNGQTWAPQLTPVPVSVTAWVVTGAGNVITGAAGVFRRTTNNGLSWTPAVGTGMGTVSHIIMHQDFATNKKLLAGDTGGRVFESANGGITWVPLAPGGTGLGANPLFVAYDADNGTTIYATSAAGGVARYDSTNPAAGWVVIDGQGQTGEFPVAAGSGIVSAAGSSTLYVTEGNAAGAGVKRTINPTATVSAFLVAPYWEQAREAVTVGLLSANETFGTPPTGVNNLWLTEGSNKLWAIDTNAALGFGIWHYTDNLTAAPTLTLDSVSTGRASLSWTALTGAQSYQLQVNTRADFRGTAQAITYLAPYTTGSAAPLLPGMKYYARVRVSAAGAGAPVMGPWSATVDFESKMASPGAVVAISPVPGAQNVVLTPSFGWGAVPGAVSYEIEVADNENFTGAIKGTSSVNAWEIPQALEYSTTYYWKVTAISAIGAPSSTPIIGIFTTMAEPEEAPPPVVIEPADPPIIVEIPPTPAPVSPGWIWAIVIIGAILVIAVVVLIVRTRRPV